MRKKRKTSRAKAPSAGRADATSRGLGPLMGKTIAVLGFGSQGEAQCLNMRDSGLNVIVGLRKGSRSRQRAKAAGFKVFETAEAAKHGDIVHVLVPDEMHAEVYAHDIEKNLSPGKTLSFSHGFSITFGLIKPPKNVDVILVSPKAPGKALREKFVEDRSARPENLGEGAFEISVVPGVFAVAQDYTGNAKKTALALAKAIGLGGWNRGIGAAAGIGLVRANGFGGRRAGIVVGRGIDECTFDEETHVNLFAEQAVLCGGLSELVKAGYETLVKAGYPRGLAYAEIVKQIGLLGRLISEGGMEHMWSEVSNTAEYGGRTRGKRVIGKASRREMKRILAEIRCGKFAAEWMAEYCGGGRKLAGMRAAAIKKKIRRLRSPPKKRASSGKGAA